MGWFRERYDRASATLGGIVSGRGPVGDVGDGFVPVQVGRDDVVMPGERMMTRHMASREKPYLDTAVARFEKASDAEVVRMLGSPEDRGSGIVVSPRGRDRRNDVRRLALAAFSDPRVSSARSPHADGFRTHVAAAMREPARISRLFSGEENVHDANVRMVDDAIDRAAYLGATGRAREVRVETETRAIVSAPDFGKEVSERFARTPKVDLHVPPADLDGRRRWVSGMIRTEAEFVSMGLLHPDDVMAIAASIKGPVPAAPSDVRIGMMSMGVNAGWIERHDHDVAAGIRHLPDAALRHRFRDVPGIVDARIGSDRAAWVANAASIERTREIMASSGIRDFSAAPSHMRSDARNVEAIRQIAADRSDDRRPVPAALASLLTAAGDMSR